MFLYQSTKGYCYNSDSIFLYNFVSTFKPRGKLLDVGCGVGIISLLLTRDFKVESTIIDKQESMLSYAKHNFALNGLEVSSHLGDFAEVDLEKEFDFIVSNPPFYHEEVTQSQNEQLNIARYAHHLPLESFIASVKKHLRPKGYFICCYDAKQTDTLIATLKTNKLNPEVLRFVHSKADREAKIVLLAARANSKSMLKVLPPLVVFDEESNYLPEAQVAFERANTHSIKGQWC